MIPTYWGELASGPITPNGKGGRRVVPAVEQPCGHGGAPPTAVQEGRAVVRPPWRGRARASGGGRLGARTGSPARASVLLVTRLLGRRPPKGGGPAGGADGAAGRGRDPPGRPAPLAGGAAAGGGGADHRHPDPPAVRPGHRTAAADRAGGARRA